MQTIQWDWLDKMIAERATDFRDGEEYHSYALVWIREQLEKCEAKNAKPNFKLLIQWSALHWVRYQSTRDADHNFGDKVTFIDQRDTPADQVMVKLDTESFMSVLNRNQQVILRMTMQGFRNDEIAEDLKVSAARVSQIRNEIRVKALEFMPEYC